MEQGRHRESAIINAIGPETFTFRGLVEEIGRIIGKPRPVVAVPPGVGYLVGSLIGKLMRDVLITREEIEGLMTGLLHVDSPPAGKTRLTQWVAEHADLLGRQYASELVRRRDRRRKYIID